MVRIYQQMPFYQGFQRVRQDFLYFYALSCLKRTLRERLNTTVFILIYLFFRQLVQAVFSENMFMQWSGLIELFSIIKKAHKRKKIYLEYQGEIYFLLLLIKITCSINAP